MATDFDKAYQFTERLWLNPAMKGLTCLQKEDQIIQFLNMNGSKLYPTLTTPAFFNGQTWSNIYQLLIKALNDLTNRELLPDLSGIINTGIDFSFVTFLSESRAQDNSIRQQLLQFVDEMIRKTESRRAMTGCYTALKSRILERYIERIFDRQKYISFELRKVQKLRMGQEEMANMLKVSLMLRPAVPFFSTATGFADNGGAKTGVIQSQFSERVIQQLEKNLNLIPNDVIRSGINSNLSFLDNNYIETTARMTAIYANLCLNYRADMKIDRGAESSDKSWFSIARRNYKYYGFDLDMINELYNIAAENGW